MPKIPTTARRHVPRQEPTSKPKKPSSTTPPPSSAPASSTVKTGHDSHLYTDDNPSTTIYGTGFKDQAAAERTLELIGERSLIYQFQTVNTLFNRAKHHPSMKKAATTTTTTTTTTTAGGNSNAKHSGHARRNGSVSRIARSHIPCRASIAASGRLQAAVIEEDGGAISGADPREHGGE